MPLLAALLLLLVPQSDMAVGDMMGAGRGTMPIPLPPPVPAVPPALIPVVVMLLGASRSAALLAPLRMGERREPATAATEEEKAPEGGMEGIALVGMLLACEGCMLLACEGCEDAAGPAGP